MHTKNYFHTEIIITLYQLWCCLEEETITWFVDGETEWGWYNRACIDVRMWLNIRL